MFKRFYITSIISNVLIFTFITPLLLFYVLSSVYRAPNMKKEEVLDYIHETNDLTVINNPLYQYQYFYAILNSKGEVLELRDKNIDQQNKIKYLDYIISLYYHEKNNQFLDFFNELPEDSNYNHIALGSNYYSCKRVELGDDGKIIFYVIYNQEDADFFYKTWGKINKVNKICMIIACLASLILIYWETLPTKRAWKQQKEFIANFSHEIRTPITVITSTLDILKSDYASAHKKWIGILNKESNRILTIINDLLFLAKSDANHFHIEKKDLRLYPILLETYISMEAISVQKGVQFTDFEGEDVIVSTNDTYLRQLISILLKNAIENTQPRGIVSLTAQKAGNNKVNIIVSDNGIGIEKKHLKYIFKRFYRIYPSHNSENGNTGLGLSIAQTIVKELKGKIIVKSEIGKGSKFIVQLKTKSITHD